MKIHYLIHADFELPGIIETWAKQQQFTQHFCHTYAGDRLPELRDFDLLVVMGGPQDLLRKEETPYLLDEISLIQKAMKANKPILGICLGAQLISEACGVATERSPNKEVGVFPIELTKAGQDDPLLNGLPEQFPVVHWHNDMPGLPTQATLLATSKGCPRQIIRYAPLVYGFQCHPEPTLKNIETMIAKCPNDLSSGKYVQTKEEFLAHNFLQINQTMIQILNNLKQMIK